jgi:hypothetical protein
MDASRTAPAAPMKLYKRLGAFASTLTMAMFLSLDYLYVPAWDVDATEMCMIMHTDL